LDTLIDYSRQVRDLPILSAGESISVRPLESGEAEDVKRLAVEAFRGYFGHYHADARLERAKCDAVYVSWAYRSCTSPGVADDILVAESNGRLAGFITLKMNDLKTGDGRLFGVAPAARGTGVAQSLMVSALAWCAARQLKQMTISTQITNLGSQKVWVRLGFEPDHAYYTLHKWFE
jgi:GNAT superfamily N-acetyltransferase